MLMTSPPGTAGPAFCQFTRSSVRPNHVLRCPSASPCRTMSRRGSIPDLDDGLPSDLPVNQPGDGHANDSGSVGIATALRVAKPVGCADQVFDGVLHIAAADVAVVGADLLQPVVSRRSGWRVVTIKDGQDRVVGVPGGDPIGIPGFDGVFQAGDGARDGCHVSGFLSMSELIRAGPRR